ncbi:NAD(P)-binding protein [Natrinema sp. DC36]|uniref:NAD(P)-binding protein n=1 Tax=Natrinema sp. DC36 TaxID=2878680 RepID=UPI001CEFFADE|nr:NAD(P)-binding protein [Natrinema sp. DC36]
METVIIGGRHVGQELSERLLAQETTAVFLEDDSSTIKRALDVGIEAHEMDISDIQALSDIGLEQAHTVIVATDSDSKNLLITQLLRVTFETDRLIVLVNHPQNLDLYDELEIETVCSTQALTTAIENVHSNNQDH